MDYLRLERKIPRQEAARELGASYGAPRYLSDHLEATFANPTILGLPTIPVASPLITDPSNPHVGKYRFILGISEIGGDDVML